MRHEGPAFRVLIHPPAHQDSRRTLTYLRQKSPRTAEIFNSAIIEAFRTIAEAPHRWRQHSRGIRIYLLSDLPYTIFYRIDGERIRILRIVHQRRHPDAWRRP